MAWDDDQEVDARNVDPRNNDDDSLKAWLARAGVPGYRDNLAPVAGAAAPSPLYGGSDQQLRSQVNTSPKFDRQYLNAPADQGSADAVSAVERDIDRYRTPLNMSDPQFDPGVRGRLLGVLAGAAAGASGRDPLAAADQAAHRKYLQAESWRQRSLAAAQQRRQDLIEDSQLQSNPQSRSQRPAQSEAQGGNQSDDRIAGSARPVWNFDGIAPADAPPPPNPPGSSPAPIARSPQAMLTPDQGTIHTQSGKRVKVGDAVSVGGKTMYVTGLNRRTGKPTVSSIRPK